MTALEVGRQGWTYRNGGEMMIKKDGKTPVFLADIIAVHEQTKKWVESRLRKIESLDDFETGD